MRRRKKHKQEEVELNLAAMLDMAFQLLTFFILTFKPSPVEGQLALRMPPPEAAIKAAGAQGGSDADNTDVMKGLETLQIAALSGPDGSLKQMSVGDAPVGTLPALERRLAAIFSEATTFEQVIVNVDSRLRYEDLMQIIDVCTRQKLPNGEPLSKLSFQEIKAN